MEEQRKHLRNKSRKELGSYETDQKKGLPIPEIQKPYRIDSKLIDLLPIEKMKKHEMTLFEAVNKRESRRNYSNTEMTLDELSYLLWETQGVQGFKRDGLVTKRVTPSGGSMHPFETYMLVNKVKGLAKGIYRYLAIEHKLLEENIRIEKQEEKISDICLGQKFVGNSAVVFIWTVRCYRTEWRYGNDSLKDILISVGHICQNLYLTCEALMVGTCAILAYDQSKLDEFIGVDGNEEISLYLASVGKNDD